MNHKNGGGRENEYKINGEGDEEEEESMNLAKKIENLNAKIYGFKESHTLKDSAKTTFPAMKMQLSSICKFTNLDTSDKTIRDESKQSENEDEEGEGEDDDKSKKKNKKKGKNKEDNPGTPVSVPQMWFNMWENYENQFWIVDEGGRVSVYEFADKKKKKTKLIASEYVSNGILAWCNFEPREGKLIAVGGVDTRVYIMSINPEVKKGEKVKLMKSYVEMTGHAGAVTGLCFLDPQFVVSSSDDSTILLWDLERPDRYIVKYNDHQVQVMSLDAFNLDSNIIASGSTDTTVRLWDIRMKTPWIRLFDKNNSSVNWVKFMFDQGNTVAAGWDDSSILIYDFRALYPIAKLVEDTAFESITSLAFSKSNRILFSSSKTTSIRIWDVIREEKIDQVEGDHTDTIKGLTINSEGTTIGSWSKDGVVQFWN